IAEYVSLGDDRRVNQVIHHGLFFYALLLGVVLLVGHLLFPLAFDTLKIPFTQYQLAYTSFMIALMSFGLSNIAGVFSSVLNGIQRMDIFNLLVAIVLPLKFLVSLLVLVEGFGLIGLMSVDAAFAAGTIIPLVWATKKYFPALSFRGMRYDKRVMKPLFRFGSQLQASRIAELVQFQFDKMVLSRFMGLQYVSLYDVGSRPLTRLRALPTTAIASLVPAVSALDASADLARIRAALIRSTRYLIILAVPVFAYIICFAHELLAAWLGPGFDQAARTMQVLAIGYAVSVCSMTLAMVSQGMGEPKYQMYATIIQAVLNILLSITLVVLFGYFGAVAGTTISIIVGALLFYYWFGKRVLERPVTTLVQICAKPLISIIPAVLVGVVVRFFWIGRMVSRLDLFVFLLVVAVLFVIVYGLMTYMMKVFSADDKGFVAGVLPGRLKYLLKFL
ncbi:MAG: polysaccharide biosynthesis C-terminal domain-containing protein, partial [Bacteroidota bacterium]